MTPPEVTSVFGLPLELVSVIISAVTGFVSGLLGYNYQRWLQRRGKVTARVERWCFTMKKSENDIETGGFIVTDVDQASEAEWSSFDLEILIRNDKEVAIEVRDPKLIFSKGRTDIVEVDVEGPLIAGKNLRLNKRHDMRLTVIPGEQSKVFELSGTLSNGAGELIKLPVCDHVDFVASYGNGKRLNHRIALLEIKY